MQAEQPVLEWVMSLMWWLKTRPRGRSFPLRPGRRSKEHHNVSKFCLIAPLCIIKQVDIMVRDWQQ